LSEIGQRGFINLGLGRTGHAGRIADTLPLLARPT
jgi:hypothetical protein